RRQVRCGEAILKPPGLARNRQSQPATTAGSTTAVMACLPPPSASPPLQHRRTDQGSPQFRMETGAGGVHDLLRRANPSPMNIATVTYRRSDAPASASQA